MKKSLDVIRYPFSIGVFVLAVIAAFLSVATLTNLFERFTSFSNYGNPLHFTLYFMTSVIYMGVAAIFLWNLGRFIIWIKEERLISRKSQYYASFLAKLIVIGFPFYTLNRVAKHFLIPQRPDLTEFLLDLFWSLAILGIAFFLFYISKAIGRAIEINEENKLTI